MRVGLVVAATSFCCNSSRNRRTRITHFDQRIRKAGSNAAVTKTPLKPAYTCLGSCGHGLVLDKPSKNTREGESGDLIRGWFNTRILLHETTQAHQCFANVTTRYPPAE